MRVVPAGHLKLDMAGRYYVHITIFGHKGCIGWCHVHIIILVHDCGTSQASLTEICPAGTTQRIIVYHSEVPVSHGRPYWSQVYRPDTRPEPYSQGLVKLGGTSYTIPSDCMMWNYGMGGGGPYSNQLPDIQLRAPSPNPSLLNSQGSSTTTRSNSPLPLPANIPDIVTWFEYVHRCESLKKNRPNFKDFGPIMESKGFYDISQLSNNDFSIGELASWLGVEDKPGVALLVMQYVHRDLDVMKAGTFVIPPEL